MSNSNSTPATAPLIDPTKRQVLPLSAAVTALRFRRRDWERSSQVREVLDSFTTVPARERYIDPAESIIMSGNEIVNSLRTGSHVVKQKRTVDFEALPELAIAEPFVPVASTVRDEAAAALSAINNRKPSARRGVRLNRPATKAPWTASPGALVVAFVIAAVVIAGLLYAAAPLVR